MAAQNMCVTVGVTPRVSPRAPPMHSPRLSVSSTSTPRCSERMIKETEPLSLLNVAPEELPVSSVSQEDQKRLQAVLEERDRNFMAAKQLLLDHALAAKEAETLANTNGDKLTPQEAQLIAKKHDEMVEVIVHELNRMELGYEKILQDMQAKEMMSQLKTTLEAKCQELREHLKQQSKPPLLCDLEQVLAKQEEPQSPRSEHQTTLSIKQTPRSESTSSQTSQIANQYLITSDEMSDHDSALSSLVSTPRTSPNAEIQDQTMANLKASRINEDKHALRMMKQLQASLTKKRLKSEQDVSAKTCPQTTDSPAPHSAGDELAQRLHFHPEMRIQHAELLDLCVDLDPFGGLADNRQKNCSSQIEGLQDLHLELEQLAKDLDCMQTTLQATPAEETFVDAPVRLTETSTRS